MMKTYIWYFLLLSFSFLYAQSKHIIAIDPGHSKHRFGARASSGATEYTYNIKIAKILSYILKENHTLDTFIINPSGEKIKLKTRTDIANENNASLFISLHHDSVKMKYLTKYKKKPFITYSTNAFSGYSIFISKKNTHFVESLSLAKSIGYQLQLSGFHYSKHHSEKIKGENHILLDKKVGVYLFDNLVVLKKTQIPAVLIECGIIVNPEEENKIKNTDYHQRFSMAIKKGVELYLKNPIH